MRVPGEVLPAEGEIELNAGRERRSLTVSNTGDRPIQVVSHFHFSEVNRALRFDREATLGFRLDIPAGTAVPFEPGESREVTLVAIGGCRRITGLNRMTEGAVEAARRRRARREHFDWSV